MVRRHLYLVHLCYLGRHASFFGIYDLDYSHQLFLLLSSVIFSYDFSVVNVTALRVEWTHQF